MKPTNKTLKIASGVKIQKSNKMMKHFINNDNELVSFPYNNTHKWVKSNSWYLLYPSNAGPIGFPRFHCLVKHGVAYFATEKNYMKPRQYKFLDELIDTSNFDVFERCL